MMRSDAIDQLISTYLEMPAKVSWKGAVGDSVRGIFEEGRLELAGLAVLTLPIDRLVFEAERFQFTPGIPARFEATTPRIEMVIDQKRVDRWLTRGSAPFKLKLIEGGIDLRLDVGGFPISRGEVELCIEDGWFVLRPKSAELLGLRNRLAPLFRPFVPIPRLAPQTRLTGIKHEQGALRIVLTLDGFTEEITPGLVERVQERFLPFAKASAWKLPFDMPALPKFPSRSRR